MHILEGNNITYTYLASLPERCAQWVAQAPCWTKEDLNTESVVLSSDDVLRIKKTVLDSGFLNLPGFVGGVKDGERYYPYTITVTRGSVVFKVTYKSSPVSTPAPAAFDEVQKVLQDTVQKQITPSLKTVPVPLISPNNISLQSGGASALCRINISYLRANVIAAISKDERTAKNVCWGDLITLDNRINDPIGPPMLGDINEQAVLLPFNHYPGLSARVVADQGSQILECEVPCSEDKTGYIQTCFDFTQPAGFHIPATRTCISK